VRGVVAAYGWTGFGMEILFCESEVDEG